MDNLTIKVEVQGHVLAPLYASGPMMAILQISFSPEEYTMTATLGEEHWGPDGIGSKWIHWAFEPIALSR